jgi:hypothetical protein
MRLKRFSTKCAVILLFILIFSSFGFSQNRRHDISLSYGIATSDQIKDILKEVLSVVLTFGTARKENVSYPGAFFITYRYSTNSRLGIGLTAGLDSSKGDLIFLDKNVGSFRENHFTFAAEVDYRWIMKRGFQLYSGLGAGVTVERITHDVDSYDEPHRFTNLSFAPQVTLVGLRFGRKIGVFAEIGGGYKGLVNIGVNGQF